MANFFWIHQGANSNWNTTGNWSTTSGGGSNGSTPTTTSDVTFDGAGAKGNDPSIVSATITILTLTFTTGYTSSVTVNATLTITSNFTDRTQHTWAGSSTISFTGTSTITSNGQTMPNPVQFSGSGATKTLSGNWTISSTLTLATNVQIINRTTAETLTVGGFTPNVATSGTATIIINGGTWNGSGVVSNNVTLTGTVTVTAASLGAATLTNSGATVTSNGTLAVGAASATSTLDTNGVTWQAILVSANNVTLTLNSALQATTFTSSGTNLTFAGTDGFTVGTFSCTVTAASTISLKNSVTYTITSSFSSFTGRNAAAPTYTSDDGTLKAVLTLTNGASCNVLANFTRIDASNGRAIYAFNGTITTCLNIFSFNDALPPAISKVIQAGGTY